MPKSRYDFVVIGSGPAGMSAAMQAAKKNKRVLVVEKEQIVGGACINTGTFPSKTLREAVLHLTGFLLRDLYNYAPSKGPSVSMENLRARLNRVRTVEHDIIRDQLARNDVDLVYATAKIMAPHEVQLAYHDGTTDTVEADFIVVASGSRPKPDEDVQIDHERILDSTSLLTMDEIPEKLTIIGGGIIGTEYATIFGALGVQVSLIDKGKRFLKFLDNGIATQLEDNFSKINIAYLPNAKNISVERIGNVVRTKLAGRTDAIDSDVLLYAVGRISNTLGLGLEATGIELNQWHYIQVNNLYQTTVPNIYAVGDVIGWPSLASTSIVQGRLAVLNALKREHGPFPDVFPFGVYTIPEISYVGLTEEEALAKGFNYVVGLSHYRELPRGQISGDTHGLLKMIVHAETEEVLGVHVIGQAATEIIHTAAIAMQHNAKARTFTENIFNFPTYSEALKIAAFNAINVIKEKRPSVY
jgi:NAD(P) transhydrogenase